MSSEIKDGSKLKKAGKLTTFLSTLVIGVGCVAGGYLGLNALPISLSIIIPSVCVGLVGLVVGAVLKNKAKKYYPKQDSFLLEESFTNDEHQTKQQENVVTKVNIVTKNMESEDELSM